MAAVVVEARCRRIPVSLDGLGPRFCPFAEDEDGVMFAANPVVSPKEFDGANSGCSAVDARRPRGMT